MAFPERRGWKFRYVGKALFLTRMCRRSGATINIWQAFRLPGQARRLSYERTLQKAAECLPIPFGLLLLGNW